MHHGSDPAGRDVGGSVRRSFAAALIGFALLAAACSGGDDVVDLDDAIGPESSTTSSSSTTTSSTSTTTTEAPEADPPEDAESAVIETWTSLLDAARTGAPDDEQLAVIESLASAETVDQLVAPLFPEFPNREIEFFPALTEQDDGTYAIDDCLVMNRGITADVSNWFVGAAEPSDDSPTGFVITEISVINLDPCVPRSIADAAIDGYEAHWDAREIFLNPPDPESPALLDTTTGDQLDLFIGVLEMFIEEGYVGRGRPTTSPEFWSFSSASELVIVDCQIPSPELGVYDAETGERTDVIEEVQDGQFDLRQTTMLLEGDLWKAADISAVTDVDCASASQQRVRVAGG